MRDPEARRGVPLRAGVSLVAVAATVAATFALAGPASAQTGVADVLTMTSAPTSVNAGSAATYSGSVTGGGTDAGTAVDGATVTVTVTGPASSGATSNPITLGGVTGASSGGSAAAGWTGTGTVTTSATGAFSFTVTSTNSTGSGHLTVAAVETTAGTPASNGSSNTSTTNLTVAAPTSVVISPKTASEFTDSTTQTFTVTANNGDGGVVAAGQPIHVTASEPTPSGGSAPTLTVTPGSGSPASGTSPQSTTAEVSGSAGQATFTVESDTAGTVTITVAADDNGAASTTTRDSASLTVIASGGSANATVTNISASPTSLRLYHGLTASEGFTVTATGSGGLAVPLATASYELKNSAGTVVQGPSNCTGTTDSKGQATCTVTTGSLDTGSYTAVFYVNNATSGATPGPDAGEPQQAVPVTIDTAPTYTSGKLSTASTDLPAGQARTIPFTVNVYNSGTTPAAAGISVAVDVHSSVSGIDDARATGTTDSNGTATVNVPVTAAETANGSTLTATARVSESPTVGDGGSIGSSVVVNFNVSTPAVQATTPVQAVKGGTVTIPVAIVDQFGNAAGSGDTLSYDVTSGSNSGTTGTVTVGSNGKANVVYTDKGATGAQDTVSITDLTHPAYDSVSSSGSFTGSTTNANVDYVSSVTPSKVTWTTSPVAGPVVVNSAANGGPYAVSVSNASGQALINQNVVFSVDRGFVAATNSSDTCSGVTASDGGSSVTVPTDTSGNADVCVGSTKAGDQTVTATVSGISQAAPNKTTYDVASSPSKPYTVSLTGPSNVALNGSAAFTATVTDEYGNPLQGETVQFTQTGAGHLTGGVSPLSGTTSSSGTVTVTLQAGDTAGDGSLTATDSNIPTATASDTTTAPVGTATAKYTVGAAVSKVKVDGIKGVTAGGTEKVAVRVWNADGSLASGATVKVTVTGANKASGSATTGSNGELGWFNYTAKNAGTDHITATIDGKKATTTVTIGTSASLHLFHPVAQANGTFLVSVQTIPAVKGARVNLFTVYHPGKADQKLLHAGNGTANANGRVVKATSPGYLAGGKFKHYKAGSTYVLVARIAGTSAQSNMSSVTAK